MFLKIARLVAVVALAALLLASLLELVEEITQCQPIDATRGVVVYLATVAIIFFLTSDALLTSVIGGLFYLVLALDWFNTVEQFGLENYTYSGALLLAVLPYLGAVLWREHKRQ